MRVCSTGEGMMAMLNVTNDHSFLFFFPLPLICFTQDEDAAEEAA